MPTNNIWQTLRASLQQSRKEKMQNKRPDHVNSKPTDAGQVRDIFSADAEGPRTSDTQGRLCFELAAFRSLIEKLACVPQGDSAWTWDHENRSFLIQAPNNVIEQYSNILTRELGKSLSLHVKRATITVDLRPWKTNANRTSLRIGFGEDDIPVELRGHTNLENLVNLHFLFRPDDSPNLQEALAKFKRTCVRIDAALGQKFEWMWETYWKENGLVFSIVQKDMWVNKSAVVEEEIKKFNDSQVAQKAGLRIELTTYNRGSSFNVRIALEGWPGNQLQHPRILPVFDAHFSI